MEIEKGRTVRIRYNCKYQDGTPCFSTDQDILTFKVGTGTIPPTLEMSIMGMKPGEHRVFRIPASEVPLFPFPKGARPRVETPSGMAYDFGPGEGGDVSESIPTGSRRSPAGRSVNIELEVLAVE